jgi:hypothetical protein
MCYNLMGTTILENILWTILPRQTTIQILLTNTQYCIWRTIVANIFSSFINIERMKWAVRQILYFEHTGNVLLVAKHGYDVHNNFCLNCSVPSNLNGPTSSKSSLKYRMFVYINPRANGAERRSGRKPGARVLIPPSYLHPGKGTH